MKKTLLKAALMALAVGGCRSVEGKGPEKQEALLVYAYNADDIQREIDETWKTLGYTERPVKYIAVNFDDGPAGAETQALLDILAQKKVKATFFLIGQNIRADKAAAKAIADAGHEIGSHSDDGAGLGARAAGKAEGLDARTIALKLTAVSDAVKAVTGRRPFFFRAPNVDYGTNLAAVCKRQGMPLIGANVWSNDWDASRTPGECMASVIAGAADGGIINWHEANVSGNRTLPLLPEMIDALRSDGFWIVSVGQLAVIKGKTLEPGLRYDSF